MLKWFSRRRKAMEPTEKFKKDLKKINSWLCKNGYFHGAKLLTEMARKASIDSKAMELFRAWLISKSTVDLMVAANGFTHLFSDDLAHFNAIDAIDTAAFISASAS
jgi:hypothetical protein